MNLAHPLALLLLVPLALWILWRDRRRRGLALGYSSLSLVEGLPASWRLRLRWLPAAVGALGLVLATLALAQPRLSRHEEVVQGEGIDIAIALDISGSMKALDFEPQDRLGVAKETIREFIGGRPRDRIALSVFAARAFTQCPLTLDHDVLLGFLDEIHIGLIEDGTAIGLGMATATARLAQSEAESKVVILLTDGENNVPTVDPMTAAEAARALGVKVYTIGVGREGLARYPVDHPVLGRRYTRIETRIDEALLERIAQHTGGQYFRARSGESLARIFETIDELERTELETVVYTEHRQLAGLLLLPAFLLLLGERVLRLTLWRSWPSGAL